LISYAHRSAFVHEINIPYVEPLKLELKAFLNSIRQKLPPLVTGEDGLRAMEVAVKCLQGMQHR